MSDLKNTSVVKNVNTKPLNSTTLPATVTVPTTTGGRRIRKVRKSKPHSIFSFAGKKTKSVRPRKVKTSRTLITLAGAKRRSYKSRKSTGGKKIKSTKSKSKSKTNSKPKSRMTLGGKRRYKKH